MQIGTLITHEQEPSDADGTRAQHSQQCVYSHVNIPPGEGSPCDSPSNPRAPGEYIHTYIKKEPADNDIDAAEQQNSYTFVRNKQDTHHNHNLKRTSPDSDEEEDNAAVGTPDKRLRRLSDDPRPSTETVVHEFACPFYKRSRGRYCHQRSCRTSGWPSVHRVKEHLYRHHMHYVCDRCSKTFKIQENLREHLRQEVACMVSPRSVAEDAGFDAEIEKRLRSRKKIEGQNEVDKWNHMFRILFPSFNTKQPPSPFVEYSLSLQDDLNTQVVKDEDDGTSRAGHLQMMAMAAVAKQETGSKSPAHLANVANIADASMDLPPIVDGASRPEFTVYSHDGPEGVPPGLSYRSNTDPRILSRNAMYEMVQQQVWKVLSSMPNSPMAPIPHHP
ncbi:hypothetical protein F503_01181 [Ophiostoma piceae UAMH 11346]|uniref:C2H2-type domain-containing protein n=1 Tax=Ophiostoma piceae (strain UAMH 11346) TaxID=1262450 RepID=S3CPB5_OPHP1|nr:hypothetical protein F503_01181 [Ophiostoma piceae UAMH 11346]